MTERNLTCIVCPLGCDLKVQLDENKVISVSGNTCPRGEKYAQSECTNPQRTVTTTIKCDNGAVLPVKTNRTIPKEKMAECMKIINSTITPLPITIGDVIIEDVFGSNVVATKNQK